MQCWWIILGSALLFQPIYGQCQKDFDGNHLFGPTCEFLCHCKNKEQCDGVTGECPSGCEITWMGQACQSKELAFNKTVKHLDNVSPAEYAWKSVDGNTATCSVTISKKKTQYNPFWKVFFDEKETIRRLRITTKQTDALEPGFNVTVENITVGQRNERTYFPRDAELCYEHTHNSQLGSTFEISCTKRVIGNQVRISLASKTVKLTLCDVNVFSGLSRISFFKYDTLSRIDRDLLKRSQKGTDISFESSRTIRLFIPPGPYTLPNGRLTKTDRTSTDCPEHQCGKDCLTVCHCKEYNYNDKMSGTCSTGCAGRWTGPGNRCEKECDGQAWGPNCTTKCGNCKDGQPCDVKTGDCLKGCAPEYQGPKCVAINRTTAKECGDGKYGNKCTERCSNNCHGGFPNCNHVNGRCVNGCKNGWQGDNCTKECDDQYWGGNCVHKCGYCKDDQPCDIENGVCPKGGCAPGYTGERCSTKCQAGYYGNGCHKRCSDKCYYGYRKCNHTNGHCLHGCNHGWWRDNCTQECVHGYYGWGCENKCSDHCAGGPSKCNHIDGHCENNCTAGWRGDMCTKECSVYYFGNGCTDRCNATCRNYKCNHVNGHCVGGCKQGWRGDTCAQVCRNGLYGDGCKGRCSNNCVGGYNTTCNHVNGYCTGGCKPGWQGYTCTRVCRNGLYGDGCKGRCSNNCVGGYNTTCNHVNGYCMGGCKPGWQGYTCTRVCQNGSYGNGCKDLCSDNCVGGYSTICNHVNGYCTGGCKPGWRRNTCTEECQNGTYGNRCSNSCNNCARGCNHVNGNCVGGCNAGWRGDKCNKVCQNGSYGNGCKERCSDNCVGGYSTTCNHVNGQCTGGCKPGWRRQTCTEECNNGYYGKQCSTRCSSNCAEGCHHVTGKCEKNCNAGWQGDTCNEECPDGKYGKRCSQGCSTHCLGGYANCNHVTGRCMKDCTSGWEGDKCNAECPDQKYGKNCSETCGKCAGGNPCEKSNGTCMNGCDPGYIEGLCDQECPDGWYGDNCSESCGKCLGGKACEMATGKCPDRCASGYQGTHCDKECSDGQWGYNCNVTCGRCKNPPCNKTTGICDGQCEPGMQETEFCNIECTDGSYGENCSIPCGNCVNGSLCDKSDGKCLTGCSPGFHGSLCISLLQAEGKESPSPMAVGGSVVGLFVFVVVVVLAVYLLKRRWPLGEKPSPRPDESVREENNRASRQSKHNAVYENAAAFNAAGHSGENSPALELKTMATNSIYYNTMNEENVPAPKTAINIEDLKKYTMTHIKTTKLVDDFNSIPYGIQYPTNDARKPVNVSKNRYKDMYPYDHSRVILEKLPEMPDSDYINATNIDGYKKAGAYIAAQGPIENNVAEFWRMVWEKNVGTIVMVTNLVEKGKMKCVNYWNHEKTGDVSITVSSEEIFSEMIIRTFHLRRGSKKGKRTVVQFHYTAWPDKATPNGPTDLVHFLYRCRNNYVNTNAPVVVHCSAGVGRTGTFIALDILYEQGRDLGYVDIYGTVRNLRKQRLNMVQTKGQYVFLHEAAFEALVLPAPISSQQFPDVYHMIQSGMGATSQAKLAEQFELIKSELLTKKIRDEFDNIQSEGDDFSAAKERDNRTKNRDNDIIPANEFRPYLSTEVSGCNNYINAVHVQSYWAPRAFLLTQAPLPCTTVDCCRLIYDRSIRFIVTFDQDELAPAEKYLPDRGKLTVGPFETKLLSVETKNGYVIRSHQFFYKGTRTQIKQAVYKDWNNQLMVPRSPDSFLAFMEEVRFIQRSSDTPILVQCQNGADKSGLFVVMMNVFERLRTEGDVAIPQTIRQLRTRRKQIVPNYDQYKFCHDLVLQHLEGFNTYANV